MHFDIKFFFLFSSPYGWHGSFYFPSTYVLSELRSDLGRFCPAAHACLCTHTAPPPEALMEVVSDQFLLPLMNETMVFGGVAGTCPCIDMSCDTTLSCQQP